MIGIIDYGVGNLRSVQKAFERCGSEAEILRQPDQAERASKLVLPGVGAYADGMSLLHERGWSPVVRQWCDAAKPLLGVCLGMQLLFEGSEEDAASPTELVPGLGVLPGKVVRFQEDSSEPGHERLKVPHMGWNTLRWKREDPLLAGLEQDAAVYFVHSYYCQPTDTRVTSGWCDYGVKFCATVWRDHVWATQFHPEKSQDVGLRILRNFASL